MCLRRGAGPRFVVHEKCKFSRMNLEIVNFDSLASAWRSTFQVFQLCPSCEHHIMTAYDGMPLPNEFRIMMKCPDPRVDLPKAEPSAEQENNDLVTQRLRLMEDRLASIESKLEQLLLVLPSSRIVNDS